MYSIYTSTYAVLHVGFKRGFKYADIRVTGLASAPCGRSGFECLEDCREPLMRVAVVKNAADFALVVSISHIVADGRPGSHDVSFYSLTSYNRYIFIW